MKFIHINVNTKWENMQMQQNNIIRFYSLDVLRGFAALPVVLWHLAVDLFFCISGFVFYWLYSQKIKELSISAAKFAMLRFSRLYPLHALALAVLFLLQSYIINTSGSSFVYEGFRSFFIWRQKCSLA